MYCRGLDPGGQERCSTHGTFKVNTRANPLHGTCVFTTLPSVAHAVKPTGVLAAGVARVTGWPATLCYAHSRGRQHGNLRLPLTPDPRRVPSGDSKEGWGATGAGVGALM